HEEKSQALIIIIILIILILIIIILILIILIILILILILITIMAYYNTIKDPSTFVQKARGKANFAALYRARDWESAVSKWDSKHLFASRVLCSAPNSRLPLFSNFFPESPRGIHHCIDQLIDGPASIAALAQMSEPQLVQQYEPDSLGYLWSALAAFVQAILSVPNPTTTPSTPKRESKKPSLLGDYVRSDQIQIESSPPDHHDRPPSSGSSVGYVEKLEAPLLEDATVRLASCFIRCVLNYAQAWNKPGPFVRFRDERLTYSYSLDGTHSVRAVDEGGLQLQLNTGPKTVVQVAQLEGKRTFNTIVNGRPVVTDGLLAQMVGEALALERDDNRDQILPNHSITILVCTHYVSFFHFHMTDDFLSSFERRSTTDSTPASFLRVDSTRWFDIKMSDQRQQIVSHLLALIAWADATAG
ncbi:Uncharacterized protein TPAR_02134, partial [Tolypocladium paradoxum]